MTTDNNTLNINNWFEEDIIYEGEGYAEFSNPSGWIKGHAKVTFDQSGKADVHLDVSEWKCEHGTTDFDYIWLIRGIKPRQMGSGFQYTLVHKNACTRFQVKTENGLFEALGTVHYNGNFSPPYQANFNFFKSQYTVNNHSDTQYWVMPLTNFVSNALITSHVHKHNLDNHPLRIFTPPQLEDDYDPFEHDDEIRNLRLRNYFIEFGFGESLGNLNDNTLDFDNALSRVGISPDDYKPYDLCINKHSDFVSRGFIEILPNYDEKTKTLSLGQSKYQITSLMVGCYKNMPKNLGFDEIIKQLPTHFSLLLSFASGNYVGVPCVELRASSGELVSRLHTSWGQLPYQKGIISLDQSRGWGITNLLTNAPLKIEQNLREAMRLAIKVRHYNHMSDIMSDLFRAFETLTEIYRKAKREFVSKIDSKRYEKIDEIINNAFNAIIDIGKQASGEEKNEINNTIANNAIKDALTPKKPTLAQAIIELVKSLGLKDVEAVPDIENWVKTVNNYRNQVIHEVYFDFENITKNQSFSEAGTYLVHLYDLLIRIILKMLNYDGIYRSYLKSDYVIVDWVQPTTPPSELGYK